jgi:hypothetical protein
MRYDNFRYLWPPRPVNAIPPQMLRFYEQRGWMAQAKKNGTCNIITVDPKGKLHCMNRHKETHKLWEPTEDSSEAFLDLPRGWYVFVAELLHNKVKGIRDTNYINDILVCEGEYLVGMTFRERQSLLYELFENQITGEAVSHYVINDHTWLARNYESHFDELYNRFNGADDEGIVLKVPSAQLNLCLRESSNVQWSVKCRRAHANYSF